MLPAASSLPFGSNPSSRRIQRIQNPSACNWIQPPTPQLAHGHNNHGCGPGVVNDKNYAYPQQHTSHPHPISSHGLDRANMSEADSREAAERMRQSLPFPNAMISVSSSNASSSNPTLHNLQRQSSSRAPFPFNQTPCTSFSTNATAGAFVFSGLKSGAMLAIG